ncbi:MAG TPA: S8 family serine peptidase [Gaiellaceae bacterium]|nr:S8 family serine peptidase [Gaiellaceae bacterium]
MHRNRLLLPLAGALALAACSSDRAEVVAPTSAPHAGAEVSTLVPGRYMVLAGAGGFGSDFASRVAALGGTVEQQHAGAGFAVVSGLTATSASQVAGIAGITNVVQDAEYALDTPASIEADASDVQAGDAIASQANPATAARYAWQWNMRLIQADKAWAAGKLGNAGVTVAILDTGLDYTIPDLNGLVDLSRSTSVIATDNAIRATYFPTRNDVTDFNGHGTNVATQVSSKAPVHAGVTSKTTLIGVKVLNWQGHGNTSTTLAGLLWAADHGADVANMSLGGGFLKAGNGLELAALNRVLGYVNAKGMLVVVAAGNDAINLDHDSNYTASYCDQPHVICVTAVGPTTFTGEGDTPSFYTNFGRSSVDVAGPGGNAQVDATGTPNLVSAWPWGLGVASWVWSYCPKDRIASINATTGVPTLTVCAAGNRVSGFIGTSQATPHVAGLAALLVAEMGHGRPSQIKAAIQQSADDRGQPGDDPYFGRGRINVAKALGL